PLDDQHERVELAARALEEPLEEIVGAAARAALEVDQRPVDGNAGQPGQGAEGDLLDGRLGGSGQSDGVPVATEACVDPEQVDERFFRWSSSRHCAYLPRRDQLSALLWT